MAALRPAGGVTGILVGGFAAGVLDIVYAFVDAGRRGSSPLRVLQAVASGLLGAEAFEGGVPAGVLGLVCHFVIAFGAAAVYYLAAAASPSGAAPAPRRRRLRSPRLSLRELHRHPLSAAPLQLSYPPRVLLQGFVSHALLVGIPIALAIRRFSFR